MLATHFKIKQQMQQQLHQTGYSQCNSFPSKYCLNKQILCRVKFRNQKFTKISVYNNGGDDSQKFIENLANSEAAEIFETANKLANDAVRFELEEEAALQQTTQSESLGDVQEEEQIRQHLILDEKFEFEYATQIAAMLVAIKSPFRNTNFLSQKIQKMRQLLPGIDIEQIICDEISFLHVSLNSIVQRMVTMSIFFNNRNVIDIISKEPRLLMDDNLDSKLQQSLNKLKEAFPGATDKVDDSIVGWLADSPTTIYRLQYHLDKPYSELPIDIQNSLMFVGRQAGYVYQAVDGFVDNYND